MKHIFQNDIEPILITFETFSKACDICKQRLKTLVQYPANRTSLEMNMPYYGSLRQPKQGKLTIRYPKLLLLP